MISQGKLSPEGRSVEPHVCDNFMFTQENGVLNLNFKLNILKLCSNHLSCR